MKIGVNTFFLVPGDVGGTEIYLRNSLLALAEINPRTTFVLFTTSDNHELFSKELGRFDNIEFVRFSFKSANRPLRIILEQVLIPFAVRKTKVQVLWSPGYTAPALCSCPQAVTIHDLQYKIHPEDLTWFERIVFDFLVRLACRNCDAVIAISNFSRNEIIRFDLASHRKVHTVLSGVDPSFGRQLLKVKAGTDLDELFFSGRPYILCVAHTYPHKNVHILVDAFCKIYDTIPHHLVLIGKPRLGEASLQESLKRLGPNKRVIRVCNGVEFSLLKQLYQRADLFVLPSSYEGFGLPILEAMMSGVLVVTSRKASLPEVGGKYAIYVDPLTVDNLAAKIVQTIKMEDDYKNKFIAKAAEWAALFTWSMSAKKTMKILESLV